MRENSRVVESVGLSTLGEEVVISFWIIRCSSHSPCEWINSSLVLRL